MKLCKRCNKKVLAKRSDALFCSAVCRGSHRQEQKKDEVKQYKKAYYSLNKQELNIRSLNSYYANKLSLEDKRCKSCEIKFTPTRVDKEFCSQVCGTAFWRQNNKEYIKKDQKDRYHGDINRKISTCLRSRLNKALKGNVKSKATMQLLGCSIEELKTHLESQFEPWMNWNNHGNYNVNKQTWQIDHIRPMSTFDLSNNEQQALACHYLNLKPLLAKSNLIKGANYGRT